MSVGRQTTISGGEHSPSGHRSRWFGDSTWSGELKVMPQNHVDIPVERVRGRWPVGRVFLRVLPWFLVVLAGLAWGTSYIRPLRLAADGSERVYVSLYAELGEVWLTIQHLSSSDAGRDRLVEVGPVFYELSYGRGSTEHLIGSPLWIPFVLCAMLCVATSVPWIRRWCRLRRRLCSSCGYDLTGNVTGVCSECGTPIEGSNSTR